MTADAQNADTSRRDVLKATGVAAVGVASLLGAIGSLAAGEEADAITVGHVTHYPHNFVLVIGGLPVTKVRGMGSVVRSTTFLTSTDSTGKVHYDRAPSAADTVSITRVYDGSRTFQDWYAGIPTPGASPTADRRDVSLVLRGRNQSKIAQLELSKAWPVRWESPELTAPSNSPVKLTETVTLVADSVTFST